MDSASDLHRRSLRRCPPTPPPPAKRRWPELLGASLETAKKTILKEGKSRGLYVQVMWPGTPETRDFRYNRVRIFLNAQGTVIRVPVIT